MEIYFWKRSIFTDSNIPAYIFIDVEPGIQVRLKCYEGYVVYIDDTVTGTNRSRGIVQLWSVNPFPLHPTPVARAAKCEIYDTSNNLLGTRRLWYFYGQRVRVISFVDENGNPLEMDYCVAMSYTREQHFYECGRGSVVNDAFGDAEPRAIIEAYRYDSEKRYLVFNMDRLPSGDIVITPAKGEKFGVVITYVIDLGVLNKLLGNPIFVYPAQFIINNIGFISSNASAYLASLVSQLVGIQLPIASHRLYYDSASGKWKLEVTYEQTPAPALPIIIAALTGAGIGAILGLFLSGAIESIVTQSAYTVQYIAYTEVQRQRHQLISKAIEYCAGDMQCIKEIIESINKAVPQTIPPSPPAPGFRPIHLVLAGAAGLGLGLLLQRVPIIVRER